MFAKLTFRRECQYDSAVQLKPTPSHPEQIYQQVGRILRARREQLQLTQNEVAEAVGLSRTSVTNIESGRQALLLHQLQRFALILRLDPRDVLSQTYGMPVASDRQRDLPREVSDMVAKILSKV